MLDDYAPRRPEPGYVIAGLLLVVIVVVGVSLAGIAVVRSIVPLSSRRPLLRPSTRSWRCTGSCGEGRRIRMLKPHTLQPGDRVRLRP